MFTFVDLDARTRELMLEEATSDGMQATEYYGRRLTDRGIQDWPILLRDAIVNGDAETLAAQLREHGRLKAHENRNTKKGVVTARVPSNAPDVLAQGEFNRYYIRALCRRVIDDGGAQVIVCRGRRSANPRPESEALVGQSMEAKPLLDDIRANPGQETLIGIPLVNSGLTVRLPS